MFQLVCVMYSYHENGQKLQTEAILLCNIQTTANLMLHDLIIWFLQQFSSHESWLGDNPYHVSKIADCYAIFNNAKNKAPPVQRSKTCP